MYSHYFYWQYMVAPLWLLQFFWILQRALLQFFSVRVMLTTLLAHWRRDRVAYRQGSFSGLLHAVAWNSISRAIGFIVRSSIIILWVVTECVFLILASGIFIIFSIAPLVALVALTYGVALLISGG